MNGKNYKVIMDLDKRIQMRKDWCSKNKYDQLKDMANADKSLTGYIRYLENKIEHSNNSYDDVRKKILEKYEIIKKSNNGFKNDKWKGFMVEHSHISKFNPNGMPNEMLFDLYIEIVKRNELVLW